VKSFNNFSINDNFARWRFGPVILSIYYELKKHGSMSVDSYIRQLFPNNKAIVYMMDNNPNAWKLLNENVDAYGHLDGASLSVITQRDNSASSRVENGTVITNKIFGMR
jgi:Uncharacterized phage-associated protein